MPTYFPQDQKIVLDEQFMLAHQTGGVFLGGGKFATVIKDAISEESSI